MLQHHINCHINIIIIIVVVVVNNVIIINIMIIRNCRHNYRAFYCRPILYKDENKYVLSRFLKVANVDVV